MAGSLVNAAAVKRYALAVARGSRHHEYTRVGQDVIAAAEAAVRLEVERIVARQPSKGKTIRA